MVGYDSIGSMYKCQKWVISILRELTGSTLYKPEFCFMLIFIILMKKFGNCKLP